MKSYMSESIASSPFLVLELELTYAVTNAI